MDITLPSTHTREGLMRRFFDSTPVILIFSYATIKLAMLTPYFFGLKFGSFNLKELPSLVFMDLFSLLVYLIIPLSFARLCLGKFPRQLGLRWPANTKLTLALLMLGFMLTLPLIIYSKQYSQFEKYYSIGEISLTYFIGVQLIIFPVYYFAEEVFFRGFLFLTLLRKIGWHSYWISDLLFTIAHMGKPPMEILLSFPAGVLLNYMTRRSQSLFPAFVVHLVSGILMFSLFNYQSITSLY